MPLLKPNNDRAKNAILMIWILLGLQLLAAVSSFLEYRLLQNVANEVEVSDLSLSANDLRELVIGLVNSTAYIVSVVLFIMWFRRAYFNLHQVTGHLSYSEGWAAGAWFVPFMNLYRPFQIMIELYNRSYHYLHEDDPGHGYTVSTRWVGWWWGLWITSGIVGQIVFRYSLHAKTIDTLMAADYLSIAATILDIPLAIVTVKVIKDYYSLERAMDEKIKLKALRETEAMITPEEPFILDDKEPETETPAE